MKNPRDQPRDNLLHTLSGSIMVLPIIIFSKFFPLKKSTDKSATEKIQLITVGLQNKNSSFLKNNVEPPNSRDIPKIIEDAGFEINSLDQMYLPSTPKFAGYNYWGIGKK